MIKALIFDCDGVLVDTERDAHRVGFNLAFKEFGIDAEWDVDLYGRLLLVAGGKERMWVCSFGAFVHAQHIPLFASALRPQWFLPAPSGSKNSK